MRSPKQYVAGYSEGSRITSRGPQVSTSKRELESTGGRIRWRPSSRWSESSKSMDPGQKPGRLALIVLVISLPRTEVILLSVQVYTPCDVGTDVGHINRRATKICGISAGELVPTT